MRILGIEFQDQRTERRLPGEVHGMVKDRQHSLFIVGEVFSLGYCLRYND